MEPNTPESGNSAESEFTLVEEGVVAEAEESDVLNTAFIEQEEGANSEIEEEVVFSDNDGNDDEPSNNDDSYHSNPSDSNQTMSYNEDPDAPTLLKLGDLEIELADDENKTTTIVQPLYPKELRKAMGEEKKVDLFEKATKTKFTKFDLVALTLSNEDKLDDTYNLGIQIGKMRNHFIKYDMHDVFTIMRFTYRDDVQKKPVSTLDLFTDYSHITEQSVADSNRWYKKWPKEPYYRENLQLTYDFLENNCTEELLEKCLEVYDDFDVECQGGPLLFIIMIKKLQLDTDNAVQYLINNVKNMKITNYEGENVSRVVSLIRGAYKRLKGVGLNKLPDEFPKWIVEVFQTSSVSEFNEGFAHLQRQVHVDSFLKNDDRETYPSVEKLLKLAEKLYLDLTMVNKWNGVTTKANQSAFPALTGTPNKKKLTCWNCGQEGHSLQECKATRNEDLIKKRKESFRAAKKKKRDEKKKNESGTKNNNGTQSENNGKWKPPTAEEKNRRIIDGKHMFWLSQLKRWVLDKRAIQNVGLVNIPAVTPVVTPPSNVLPVPQTLQITPTSKDLAIHNATHSINVAMQNLSNAMRGV
jgi:Zinc knuckle